MRELLTDIFKDEAEITGLQILIIDLPGNFEGKIVETEIQKQIERTNEAKKEAAVIRAGIDVTVANYTRRKVIIENQAKATAMLITKRAVAEAQKLRLEV